MSSRLPICVSLVSGHSTAPAQLAEHFDVHQQLPPRQGDLILFAVSCQQGVDEALLDSLDQCQGTKLTRGAILLVDHEPEVDPEQRELVELEMRYVLSSMLGDDLASDLPLLGGDDVELPARVSQLAAQASLGATLGGPDRQAWQEYVGRF